MGGCSAGQGLCPWIPPKGLRPFGNPLIACFTGERGDSGILEIPWTTVLVLKIPPSRLRRATSLSQGRLFGEHLQAFLTKGSWQPEGLREGFPTATRSPKPKVTAQRQPAKCQAPPTPSRIPAPNPRRTGPATQQRDAPPPDRLRAGKRPSLCEDGPSTRAAVAGQGPCHVSRGFCPSTPEGEQHAYGVLDVQRRMCSSAFFSNRLTCACEIPISPATSIWVRPWKNRNFKICCSRSLRRLMASFTPM